MFPERSIIIDPVVVVRKNLPNKEFTFEHHKVEGEFFLVIPSCAKEVYYIQMLGKNIDVFLPVSGEGLLVRSKCLHGFFPLAD
jgi:hypothetical protein